MLARRAGLFDAAAEEYALGEGEAAVGAEDVVTAAGREIAALAASEAVAAAGALLLTRDQEFRRQEDRKQDPLDLLNF